MPSRADWIRVIYHEAGHVVVTMSVADIAAPVVLRCVTHNGVLLAQGTFQSPIGMQFAVPGAPPIGPQPTPKSLVMRCAAGGVAEDIQFGNHQDGVTGDYNQINMILAISHNAGAASEQENGFPDTKALLRQEWNAVERVAEIAIRRLDNIIPGEDAEFPNTQILSAAAVRRIYQNAGLNEQGHQQALEGAYYYALKRCGGHEPPFDQFQSQDDFHRAAGDVLGKTG